MHRSDVNKTFKSLPELQTNINNHQGQILLGLLLVLCVCVLFWVVVVDVGFFFFGGGVVVF